MKKVYACIDLKSFYASVECVLRGLDPLDTNLVVADISRTEKTICLAVTPSLKAYGLSGRSRLYEVVSKVKEVNSYRRKKIRGKFTGKSFSDKELKDNLNLELDYIVAKPQMRKYMEYSNLIYNIYLKYLSKEDIHVYSIDEVFLDLTPYLRFNKMSPRELVTKMIQEIYNTLGITATAGIGVNMYLAKVAMDIVAKHVKAGTDGVRITGLDEITYRRLLWGHMPITDFWGIGKGIQKRLAKYNMYTMGDIAACSISNEDLLFKIFGVNAEILIDHAWGYEPCTMEHIKRYCPNNHSKSVGQVLHEASNYDRTKLIVKEMADSLSLDLTYSKLLADKIVLTIGYDIDNLLKPEIRDNYLGEITLDYYGRRVPKPAHGTISIPETAVASIIIKKVMELYDKIVNPKLLVRRINISANVMPESVVSKKTRYEQCNIFTDYHLLEIERKNEVIREQKEKDLQGVLLKIKNKYGANAILKGMNYLEGGTARDRNMQVGGHSG